MSEPMRSIRGLMRASLGAEFNLVVRLLIAVAMGGFLVRQGSIADHRDVAPGGREIVEMAALRFGANHV